MPGESRPLSAIARLVDWPDEERLGCFAMTRLGSCALMWGGERSSEADREDEDMAWARMELPDLEELINPPPPPDRDGVYAWQAQGVPGALPQETIHIIPLHLQHLGAGHKLKRIAVKCSGKQPPRKHFAASGIIADKFYVFGGFSDGEADWKEDMHSLCLRTLVWKKWLPSEGQQRPTARDKTAHWMWDSSLYVFGGIGLSLARSDPGSRWIGGGQWLAYSQREDAAWNNQLLRFDGLHWHSLAHKGDIPSPRSGSGYHRHGQTVFVFGGRSGEARLNDLFSLCLRSLTWRRLCGLSHAGPAAPHGRGFATLNIVPGTSRLLIWGGVRHSTRPDTYSKTLGDVWAFDLNTNTWTMEGEGQERRGHVSILHDGVLAVIGGDPKSRPNPRWTRFTTVESRRVQPASLLRLAFLALPLEKNLNAVFPSEWLPSFQMRRVLHGRKPDVALNLSTLSDIVEACTLG